MCSTIRRRDACRSRANRPAQPQNKQKPRPGLWGAVFVFGGSLCYDEVVEGVGAAGAGVAAGVMSDLLSVLVVAGAEVSEPVLEAAESAFALSLGGEDFA